MALTHRVSPALVVSYVVGNGSTAGVTAHLRAVGAVPPTRGTAAPVVSTLTVDSDPDAQRLVQVAARIGYARAATFLESIIALATPP
jgi:hypothetical protein